MSEDIFALPYTWYKGRKWFWFTYSTPNLQCAYCLNAQDIELVRENDGPRPTALIVGFRFKPDSTESHATNCPQAPKDNI